MPPSSFLNPWTSLKVSKHQIPAFKGLPNTSLQNKPLFIYHSAYTGNSGAAEIERHLKDVAVVSPAWRYTMYSETHFHSTTHEVLVIASGKAKCCFGGEENPGRLEPHFRWNSNVSPCLIQAGIGFLLTYVEPMLEAGDVVIVPAGVAHRLLEEFEGFLMVGSYPVGKEWDMCYGREDEKEKVKSIKDLAWFERDPIYGDTGPLLDA